MATCPMCNAEVDDAEMGNHTNTVHPDTGGSAGGEDTAAPTTPPPSEPAQ